MVGFGDTWLRKGPAGAGAHAPRRGGGNAHDATGRRRGNAPLPGRAENPAGCYSNSEAGTTRLLLSFHSRFQAQPALNRSSDAGDRVWIALRRRRSPTMAVTVEIRRRGVTESPRVDLLSKKTMEEPHCELEYRQ